jgi:hypothetical protein
MKGGQDMKRIITTVSLLALLTLGATGSAADIVYPTVSFSESELAAVRAWEKQWAGTKITSQNLDQVKDFLPESIYDLMKDTERWGESWFVIAPYKQINPTAGQISYTKTYAGQPSVGPSGELLNWIAGVPFPNAKTGIEMAHNYRMRTYGDGYSSTEKGYIIDGRLKYDMDIEIQNNLNFFAGRTDVPPVPEYEDNPKQIWRAFTMLQLAPPETRNMRIMEINYKDQMKAYDSWFWMPSIRRVRRRSTTERQDAQGGGDFCGYDNLGWDGPVQINTYSYLGQKDVLLARHNDSQKLSHTPGKCLWDGVQRERIKAHVIEAVSQDPNFLYTKMIWYLDPETWNMLYSDRYDRRGNLWKVMDQFGFLGTGYEGMEVAHFDANQMIDVQRIHSTCASSVFEFGKQFDARMFTLQYLQKRSY